MILVLILFLAGGGWALSALMRRLKKHRAGAGVWIAFAVFAMIGVALGIWCSFVFEYSTGPKLRVVGLPIPVAFFHLEDGQWVDFVVPPIQAWTTVFTNLVLLTVGTTLPMWLFARPIGKTVCDDEKQIPGS